VIKSIGAMGKLQQLHDQLIESGREVGVVLPR
jgi:hypothetical protein